MVNDGLVLIGKFNIYLKRGMPFEDALIAAGKSRFRAIFLTSITTIAGLAPFDLRDIKTGAIPDPHGDLNCIWNWSCNIPDTCSCSRLLLSVGNSFKVGTRWLWTGKKPTREEVERAIKEKETEVYEIY